MSWGSFLFNGAACDLTHLDPFTIAVTPKAPAAPTYKVLVTFGHHTFTRDWKEGVDDEAHKFTAGGDVRCFCPERFPLSQQLPGIVRGGANGKAYFTQGRNFMFVEGIPGLKGPYAVFFNLERARNLPGVDALMFVVSAYEKPGLPPKNRLQPITVPTLVAKTLGNQQVVRTRKKRRKK